ncbi:MAG: MmcQ/YjbR family DNA-binding protein [Bacteroidaceae bacterium]|nr:MmcQ/YjbR family DNA-binding protein [Bacteroidaceae bacterium]
MNTEEAREYCLSKPFTTEDMPFGDDYVAFRVGGKIFAGLPLEQRQVLVLKCDPAVFDEITATYPSIRQAWHWHKRHWMELHLEGEDIAPELVRELTDHAYEWVFSHLTKKAQRALTEQTSL